MAEKVSDLRMFLYSTCLAHVRSWVPALAGRVEDGGGRGKESKSGEKGRKEKRRRRRKGKKEAEERRKKK